MTTNPRLQEVTTALVHSVAQVLHDHRVTEAEFYPAVGFLADLAQKGELGLLTDALGLTRIVDDNTHRAEEQGGTPSNVLGPYYREGAPFIDNGGNVAPDGEPGEPLKVTGQVTDTAGQPLAGAVIDVWQCNASGEYEHQVTGKDDYYLRRRLRTDAEGRYSFRTVRPVPYEIPKSGPVGTLLAMLDWHAFRPAHIHFKVTAEGQAPLVTQMYFADDDWLHDDRVNAAKDDLAVKVTHTNGTARAEFDVRLCPAR
jgi:catechol 1,2-dioxygenase